MAGSALVVGSSNPYLDNSEQCTVTLDWTSDASAGTVSIDIASTFATAQAAVNDAIPQPKKLKGYIVSMETIAGENGDLTTAKPDDLYDIELQDSYDYDVAGGTLANRSGGAGAVAEKVVPTTPIPIDSEITVEISAAGNSKKGRIILSLAPSL